MHAINKNKFFFKSNEAFSFELITEKKNAHVYEISLFFN